MKALVTGGGGFLGGAIVRALLNRGDQVRSFSRGDYPSLRALGVELFRGDLAEEAGLRRAVQGCEVVFHAAAKTGIWGPLREYFQTNVEGTRNVLAACRSQGVPRLVYTSSPSVIFDGRDMAGVNESVPYPRRYLAHYPRTKAEAEKRVLAANSEGLATVVLRPHLLWGPEDTQLVPRILERGRKGRLRRIGNSECKVDSTFIDNAAEAHLAAADRLKPNSPVAGKAYFISNGEPYPLWDLINRILAAGGISPVKKTVSPQMAYALGCVLEGIYSVFRLPGEPPMTRFLAEELSTAHWFDISAAKKDFGYEPRVNLEEGLKHLKVWLEIKRNPRPS